MLSSNINYEKAVIGWLLIGEDVEEILRILEYTDFYFKSNQDIYRTIKKMYEKNINIDIFVVISELEKINKLETIGGEEYLKSLSINTTTKHYSEYYAKELKNLAIRRNLDEKLAKAREDIFVNENIDEVLENIEYEILEEETRIIQSLINEQVEYYENLKQGKNSKIYTGFKSIDDLLGGYAKGSFNVIGAETSIGKSAFALNVAYNNLKQNKTVLYYSLEMTRNEILDRLFSNHSSLFLKKIQNVDLTEDETIKLASSFPFFEKKKLFLNDTYSLSTTELKINLKLFQKREKLDLLIIDHLGLITHREAKTQNERVGNTTRDLKMIAKQFNIPILCLCQLNRDIDNKKPTLRRLRDSGNIEQDADSVCFLYRKNRKEFFTDFIVEKNRNGTLGEVELMFNGGFQRFRELENRF